MGVASKRALGQQTDAALRRGVRSCYVQIAKEANVSRNACLDAAGDASRPTTLGVHRKDLVKGIKRMQESETVTKGSKRYRELTKTKAREKEKKRAKNEARAGWTLDRLVMRLGGAAAVQAASACAAAHGAQARRWLGARRTRASPGQVKAAKGGQVPRRLAAPREEARPISVGGVALRSAICPAPRSSTVKVLPSLSTMRSETALAVKSKLHDGSSAYALRNWVVAVAFGKFVHVDSGLGSVERFRLTPALGRAHDMWFAQKFVSLHPELAKITSAIAKGDGSNWRVWPTSPPRGGSSRNALEIDSSASFVRWLRSMMVRG